MKKPLLLLLFLFSFVFHIQAQDKTVVTPYNKTLITTGKGVKSHITWAKFPSEDAKIRKIVMYLTLATPQEDWMSCAHWDYTDRLTVIRKGGINGDSLDYEIARMLTPYGNRNPKDWSFTWELDVTDFASILRDSVEFNYTHSGWEPSADRGWGLTIDFEVTYGEPAYKTIAIHKVYDDNYKYGLPNDPIENHLTPRELKLSPKTNYLRSVTIQTGHGSDSLYNSEFSPKWKKLFWNDKEVSHKLLWTEGGDNPLYPQGGTWVYDRGNWIPGMLINPDVCDLLVKGGTKGVFDLNMEPYTIYTKPSAMQYITSYLIEYKTDIKANDVEIADIIVPSKKQIHGRKNPSNEYPVILVKNHSAKPITSMTIHYYDHSEEWRGTIAPFAVAEIKLSNRVNHSKTLFEVSISRVNGKKDSYPADNQLTSQYAPVPVHKGNFTIILNGNEMSGKENTMTLTNITTGKKVLDYPLGKVGRIKEVVNLPNGDYFFEVTDSQGDGLSFWANKEAGHGNCWIMSDQNEIVKYFDGDFGNNIRYWFTVDNSLAKENIRKEPYVTTKYKEVNKHIFSYLLNNNKDDVKFVIKNYVGKEVMSFIRPATEEKEVMVDMTSMPVGLYFVELWQNGYKTFCTVSVREIKTKKDE